MGTRPKGGASVRSNLIERLYSVISAWQDPNSITFSSDRKSSHYDAPQLSADNVLLSPNLLFFVEQSPVFCWPISCYLLGNLLVFVGQSPAICWTISCFLPGNLLFFSANLLFFVGQSPVFCRAISCFLGNLLFFDGQSPVFCRTISCFLLDTLLFFVG